MEVKQDLKLLLDCIKCQLDDSSAVKQAFVTIANICSNQIEAKELMRKGSGLGFLLDIVLRTSSNDVRDVGIYTLGCAVENNCESQKHLTTPSVFSFVQNIIKDANSSHKSLQSVAFFILCLLSENGLAQKLIRETGCMTSIIKLFQDLCMKLTKQDEEAENVISLWSYYCNVLSACLGNGTNEENQRRCIEIFPQTSRLLQTTHRPDVAKCLSSLVSFIIEENVSCQQRWKTCNGVAAVASALHRFSNRARTDPEHLQAVVALAATIHGLVESNEDLGEDFVRADVLPALVHLIRSDTEDDAMFQILNTIASLLSNSDHNLKVFTDLDGVNRVIKLLNSCENPTVDKVSKCLLQLCVSKEDNKRAVMEKQNKHFSRQIAELEERFNEKMMFNQKENKTDPQTEESFDIFGLQDSSMINISKHKEPYVHDVAVDAPQNHIPMVTSSRLNQSLGYQGNGSMDAEMLMRERDEALEKLMRIQGQLGSLPDGSRCSVMDTTAQSSRSHHGNQQGNCGNQQQSYHDDQQSNHSNQQSYHGNQQSKHGNQQGNYGDQKQSYHGDQLMVDRSNKSTTDVFMMKLGPGGDNNTSYVSRLEEGGEGRKEGMQSLKVREKPRTQDKEPQLKKREEQCMDPAGTGEFLRPSTPVKHRRQSVTSNSVTSRHGKRSPSVRSSSVSKHTSRLDLRNSYLTERNSSVTGHDSRSSKRHTSRHDESSRHSSARNASVRERSFSIDRSSILDRSSSVMDRSFSLSGRPISRHSSATPRDRSRYRGRAGSNLRRSASLTPGWGENRPPSPASPGRFDAELLRRALDTPCPTIYKYQSTPVKHTGPREAQTPDLLDLGDFRPGEKSFSVPRSNVMAETTKCGESSGKCRHERTQEVLSELNRSSHKTDKKCSSRHAKLYSCTPPGKLGIEPLNSRNYNVAIETCCNTCPTHKAIRKEERKYIAEIKKTSNVEKPLIPRYTQGCHKRKSSELKVPEDIYEFGFTDDEMRKKVSPVTLGVTPGDPIPRVTSRRPRVAFTREEEQNIVEGVAIRGRNWGEILRAYPFHPSRKHTDLMYKFKQMMKRSSGGSVESLPASPAQGNPSVGSPARGKPSPARCKPSRRCSRPFSMVEERRLARGVRRHGPRWTTILSSLTFAEGRTAEDLRNHWRSMSVHDKMLV